MKKLLFIACLFLTTINIQAQTCSELFIAGYCDGVENIAPNKALAIFNPTDAPIDLSDYSIAVYENGANQATIEINLTGIIAPKAIKIIGNVDTSLQPYLDITSSELYFNGNDAVSLRKMNETWNLDANGLSKGIYLLKLNSENTAGILKIVIQ